MEWQPIETCPDMRILNHDGGQPFVLVHWKRESRADYLPLIDVSNTAYLQLHRHMATHWMPLPPPPHD